MIRILQLGISNKFNIGGIETYMLNQYFYLNKDKFQYDFLLWSDKEIAFKDIFCKNSIIYTIPERRKHPFAYYYRLVKFFVSIRKVHYDAIVFNTGGLEQMLPLVIAKFIGIKMRVVHSHGSGTEIQLGILRKLQYAVNRKLLQFSITEYWACSKEASRFLFHHNNARIIHNGIETKKFIYSTEIRYKIRDVLNLHGKFVIGHVGRFSPVKNHLFLLDIFYELYRKNKNAVLLLVGDDSNLDNYDAYISKIKHKIEFYGIKKSVLFTGYTDDVANYYQAMDVFCLPSKSEGMPLCVLEAQASDLPCVVSTGVPMSVKVIDDVKFLSLSDKKSWAIELDTYSKVKRSRHDNYDVFCQSGYDAKYSTKEVEKHFLKVLNDE